MQVVDHYDVLGVRPNAGHTEIELAFKGRRSQYHPDRYSGEDAETQKWATEQIQRVNAAYAVLSDPEQRQRYDQSRSAETADHRHDAWESSRRSNASEEAAAVLWRDFLADSVVPQLSTRTIFCAPGIPDRKLEGALATYGTGLAAQDVTLLLDDTVLGGGQRGMLLTDDALLLHGRAGRRRLRFEEITSLESSGTTVRVNGTEQAAFDRQASNELGCLVATLGDYLECSRYVAPSTTERSIDADSAQRLTSMCRACMGPASFSGAASCAIRPGVPVDVSRVARFALGLAPDEDILAWSNLALHGHADAFAVTTHGLHSKVGSERSFMSWDAVRHLELTGEFTQGVRCGIAFNDGSRLLCSRLRGDGQTFGGALFKALASCLAN